MPEELKPEPKEAVGQEAELAAQNMAEGKEKKPEVDVDKDYEASKNTASAMLTNLKRVHKGHYCRYSIEAETPEPDYKKAAVPPTGSLDDGGQIGKAVKSRAS